MGKEEGRGFYARLGEAETFWNLDSDLGTRRGSCCRGGRGSQKGTIPTAKRGSRFDARQGAKDGSGAPSVGRNDPMPITIALKQGRPAPNQHRRSSG
jgi:hypothetical protein